MLVGASCVDIRLRARLRLTGPSRREVGGAAVQAGYLSLDDAMLGKLGLEVPPAEGPRPYTANTTWAELGQSGWIGWLVLSIAHPNPNPNPNPTPSRTLTLSLTLTLARSLSLSLTRTRSRTRTRPLTLALTLTLTR